MKKFTIAYLLLMIAFSLNISAQIQTNILVQIVKAEDERRYDSVLENLMKSPDQRIRTRAALAAGRIGNDAAIPALASLLENDKDAETRTMAAFALGEIESIKASDAILKILSDTKNDGELRARAVEAAGKIAAASAKDASATALGRAILTALDFERNRRSMPNEKLILLGLTSILRVRPEGGEAMTAQFLDYSNPRIRADALNTLSRLKAKSVNPKARELLKTDEDAIVRANAARVLGAAEDKDSLDVLLNAALTDADSRVRVSAIRAVGSLKNKNSAAKLLEYGEKLLKSRLNDPSTVVKPKPVRNPAEKNELLEIATALGRILPNSDDKRAVEFLDNLRQADKYSSPETEIALARIAPKIYVASVAADAENLFTDDWRTASAAFQGLGEIAGLEANKETDATKSRTRILLVQLISAWLTGEATSNKNDSAKMAIPDLLNAFAAFKSENTSGIMRPILDGEEDIFIRAAIAGILADQTTSKENVEALKKAFDYSLLNDKFYNDATLATMDALFKLDKKEASSSLIIALNSTDYLVRKKAFELLADKDLQKELPGLPTILENARTKKKNQLSTFSLNSKLGVIFNTNADYVRAVSRRNGSVKAVLTTEKGAFTIDLMPEDAPLTVDNFIKLARADYFNNLSVHRVVPNFVMQDGDPRGDGNGGPGWEIRCEINLLSYERGAVGMALSGKDTGGSQWFVTHSPQPHLDGGYTVFGKVNEPDMKVVDSIVRGDKILSVKIIENISRRGAKLPKKR